MLKQNTWGCYQLEKTPPPLVHNLSLQVLHTSIFPLCSISFVFQDPVCGSAHCSLAPYWSKKLGKCNFLAYMVISLDCYHYYHHHCPRHILYNALFTLFRHPLEVEYLIFIWMNKIRGCCCEEKLLQSWKVLFWLKFRPSVTFWCNDITKISCGFLCWRTFNNKQDLQIMNLALSLAIDYGPPVLNWHL